MLQKYDIGDKVIASDDIIFEAALARHPEAKEKFQSGSSKSILSHNQLFAR
jgi:hypothetical protein